MSHGTAKEDCERLMREVLPFAKQMLAEHGEFYPFGAMLRADKTIVHVGARMEGEEQPASSDLITLLRGEFRGSALRGELIASAIVFDVLTRAAGAGSPTDAIQVNLDHASGYSVEVVFPYHLSEGKVVCADPAARKGQGVIFPSG